MHLCVIINMCTHYDSHVFVIPKFQKASLRSPRQSLIGGSGGKQVGRKEAEAPFHAGFMVSMADPLMNEEVSVS